MAAAVYITVVAPTLPVCPLCEGEMAIVEGQVCIRCAHSAWEHAESFGGLLPVKIARYRKWIERQLEAKAS